MDCVTNLRTLTLNHTLSPAPGPNGSPKIQTHPYHPMQLTDYYLTYKQINLQTHDQGHSSTRP